MPILTADYTVIDYEKMSKAIGLKPKHMPMLIESFLEESVPALKALSEAIATNDLTLIASHAHAIKGTAGNLRFNEVYEMAKEMEISAKEENKSFEYSEYLQAIKLAVSTISL